MTATKPTAAVRAFLVALAAQRHAPIDGVLRPRGEAVNVQVEPVLDVVILSRHAAFDAAVAVAGSHRRLDSQDFAGPLPGSGSIPFRCRCSRTAIFSCSDAELSSSRAASLSSRSAILAGTRNIREGLCRSPGVLPAGGFFLFAMCFSVGAGRVPFKIVPRHCGASRKPFVHNFILLEKLWLTSVCHRE